MEEIISTCASSGDMHILHIKCKPSLVNRIKQSIIYNISKQADLPGFRKGNVPADIVEHHYSDIVKAELSASLLQSATQAAISRHNIEPGARPYVSESCRPSGTKRWIGTFSLDGTFSVDVESKIPPEVENISLGGLVVKPSPNKMAEDVDVQLSILATELSEISETDGSFCEGDIAVLSVDISGEGQETSSQSGILYSSDHGQILEFAPEYASAIIGQRPGFEFRSEYSNLIVNITLQKVMRRVKPRIDDTLAKKAGYESLDSLKKELQAEWIAKDSHLAIMDLHMQAREWLVLNNIFDIPDEWVSDYVDNTASELSLDLDDRNIMDQLRSTARIMAGSDYLLELIYSRTPQIELSEADVDTYMTIDAARSGTTASIFRQNIVAAGSFDRWKADAKKRKTLDWLICNAQKA